jgi:RND family efflux transporter MFP subunit
MNKNMTIRLILILFLGLVAFSCQPPQGKDEQQEDVYGASPVKVFEVKRQSISEKLTFTGLIEPWQKMNITPDTGGKIAAIHVEEGDWVKKGQLLAELDTRAILLQLEQAKAALAVAEANHKDAQRNLERMKKLSLEKAVSDQQYEKVSLAYEAAAAQKQQAQAARNLAQHQLDVSLMKAPFDGVIAAINAEEGDVINPLMGSASPNSGVLVLMDFSRVKIGVDVSHRDIVRISKGQHASLTVNAIADKVFAGRVAVVNVTADAITKKFGVEVHIDNPDLTLRPNVFGEITLHVSTHENALVIPQMAVIDNSFVFVAQDDIAVKKEIIIGLQNTSLLEIQEGLDEGMLVIVEGNYGLEDGDKIEIKEVIQ